MCALPKIVRNTFSLSNEYTRSSNLAEVDVDRSSAFFVFLERPTVKNRNRTVFSALASAVALTSAFHSASAATTAPYSGGSYTQDFNSLFTLSTPPQTFSSMTIAPIQIGPLVVGSAPIDLTGTSTDGASIPQISTMTGWWATSFGGNSSPLAYIVDDGSNSNDALTGYFDPNNQPGNGTNNMALGAVTSSSTGNVVFGIALVNNTGQDLNAITLSYTGELFHQDTGSKTLTFGYTVDPTNNATIPLPGSTTGIPSLNVGGFATGSPGSVQPDAEPQRRQSSARLDLGRQYDPLAHVDDGFRRWRSGPRHRQPLLQPPRTSPSPRPSPGSAAAAWDNGTANWAGNASGKFTNGSNNAIFGNTATDANITVQTGGVNVQLSVTVDNKGSGKYIFSGGPIGGTNATFNVKNGTVQLTANNTYTGGTNLTGGTLIIDKNSELGSANATLTFNGGGLTIDSNVDFGTRPLAVGANGDIFNLNGSNATLLTSPSVSILGNLEVSGSGTLDLGQRPTFGSSTAPAGSLTIDTGATVKIDGKTRSSASDFYNGGVINGALILGSTGGARYNFDSPGSLANGTGINGSSKFTGNGSIQVPSGSGWMNAGNSTVPSWQLDTGGIVISNTSNTTAGEIDVPIVLNSTNLPFTPLNVATADFLTANPNPTNSFVTVIGGTKASTQGHGPTFTNFIIGGVISGNSDINIGNDYKNGGSGDMTLLAHNTFTGATLISGGGGLYTGINDALPTTTDVVFGAIPGTTPVPSTWTVTISTSTRWKRRFPPMLRSSTSSKTAAPQMPRSTSPATILPSTPIRPRSTTVAWAPTVSRGITNSPSTSPGRAPWCSANTSPASTLLSAPSAVARPSPAAPCKSATMAHLAPPPAA